MMANLSKLSAREAVISNAPSVIYAHQRLSYQPHGERSMFSAAILVSRTPLAHSPAWLRGFSIHRRAVASLYPIDTLPDDQTIAQHTRGHSDEIVIGDKPDNIFYFIQVSDLHISRHHTSGGTIHFLHFLSTALPQISPSNVFATGDLTDAKDAKKLIGLQYLEEWLLYRAALEESGVLRYPGFYRDVRGNHDTFGVSGWESKGNYYRDFGADGGHPGWVLKEEKEFGRYAFVGLDACPKRGPSRPLNFYGYMDNADMDELDKTMMELKGYNHTFVLAHYPTTSILFGKTTKGGKTFNELSSQFSTYLCGHLHKLIPGVGDTLQAYQPSGFLELELGDMKAHALYRVMAVDHDLISFTDVPLPLTKIPTKESVDLRTSPLLPARIPSPPVVLVTNPKDARYFIPNREPLDRLRRSTHIRMLVWADMEIQKIQVRVDGKNYKEQVEYRGKGQRLDLKGGKGGRPGEYIPLWVAPWRPELYDDGQEHTMEVVATDVEGKVGRTHITFRVDGERAPINGGPGEWIISNDFTYISKFVFLTVYLTTTLLFLLLPKLALAYLTLTRQRGAFLAWLSARCQQSPSKVDGILRKASHFVCIWTLRFLLLAQRAHLFYPLYAYALYVSAFPWFYLKFVQPSEGERIDGGGWGYYYLYGLKIGSEWIPLVDTWWWGTWDLTFALVLPTLYLARLTTPAPTSVKLCAIGLYLWRCSETMALGCIYGGWASVVRGVMFWWCVAAGALTLHAMNVFGGKGGRRVVREWVGRLRMSMSVGWRKLHVGHWKRRSSRKRI
ncbi:uncharacterized protein VTP21DRAFT_11689 [Calcarisporiella thermophila]|uniref:uncharacterized protein n=1 Tax=Calcarisporiella thermophila TaxID=911321 RepID=UPI003743DC6D